MKTYSMKRHPGGRRTATLEDKSKGLVTKPLDPCNHIIDHSPDGFEWGYAGSGPSQLALAILCDHIGCEAALEDGLYQDFKRDIVTPHDFDEWSVTSDEIDEWLDEVRKK